MRAVFDIVHPADVLLFCFLAFGGGTGSNLGASGVAERNLNRITVVLALLWVASIIVLGLIVKFSP